MSDSKLVYSTEHGRVCPDCGKPQAECRCRASARAVGRASGDGVVRIRREVKGRGGKTVTVLTGFQLPDAQLKALAAELKRRCGTGGSVVDGDILIQGDHRTILAEELKRRGIAAKLAGG
jgi:translation initiation factor 1